MNPNKANCSSYQQLLISKFSTVCFKSGIFMFSGMLFIFLPLVFGYLFQIKNENRLNQINKLVGKLISLILLLMGISIAKLDNLTHNIGQVFTISSIFFIFISLCNLAALPLLDKYFSVESAQKQNKISLLSMAKESLKLMLVVLLGGGIGLLITWDLPWLDKISEITLQILIFFIGIQLRNSGLTLKQIILNKKGLTLAITVCITSLIGGLISALILDIPINHGLAIASGFGWYSLSGILMGEALGPIYGGASFILELSREIVAIMLIPILIRQRPLTAIGYGGATSMDFTLPIIQTTGGMQCVPIAIVSGFILSLLVPILMLFFVNL